MGQVIKNNHNTQVYKFPHFVANYLEKEVAASGWIYLLFKTNSKTARLTIELSSEGKSYFNTYSNSDITSEGTAPDGNKLTNFAKSCNCIQTANVYYNPSIYDIGEMRGNQVLFGGLGPKSTGTRTGDKPSIIAANTTILIALQNATEQAKDLEIIIEWDEV